MDFKKVFWPALLILIAFIASAQDNLPVDYLSKEFHKSRREAFRKMMPEKSVAVIFAFPERTFSNDVTYFYHQNPDLYYLTGYKEPGAVLLLFKELQKNGDQSYNELFFVRSRDINRETWTGKRLGADGVKEKLGIAAAYDAKNFKDFPIDFKAFNTVLYDYIYNDAPDDGSGCDVFGLIESFKKKSGIIPLSVNDSKLNSNIANVQPEYLSRVIDYLKSSIAENDHLQHNIYIQRLMEKPDSTTLREIQTAIKSKKNECGDFNKIMDALRQAKTPEELVLLRKAINISSAGHAEVIKAGHSAMSENEADGIHRYIHRYYGAEDEGYPLIVGAGKNGCVLHYQSNNALRLNNDLLLMDVGAEYHGYTADITRTFPGNGKFSAEQKAIYQLVYKAQEEVFKLCKEGTMFSDLNKKASEVIAEGLLQLGIITNKEEAHTYYPHGCSHYLGLDVHDRGDYNILLENEVITVEPGIYIPEGSKCDKKWWNIGVRIEDDVLIKKDNCEILSGHLARKLEDVEKLAAQKSKFNEMKLPPL
ncbi:MAG: aminopeptidase P family protein [Agriterribacter sp.]